MNPSAYSFSPELNLMRPFKTSEQLKRRSKHVPRSPPSVFDQCPASPTPSAQDDCHGLDFGLSMLDHDKAPEPKTFLYKTEL
mmetsp:Transcript_14564/g.37203  ORF Transcript_14564/g.37203 Transcript_14564/m.37203 type:complete len:82 (-) Transcript_14564:740-985(-)